MPGRVLTFFEFSDKYSTGSSDPLNVDSISGASSNFEEGFDDTTYDQPELGPKRQISGEYEATPAAEPSAFKFGQDHSGEMNAPAMEEDEEEDEEDDLSEETEEDEDDDTEPTGNPEEANENYTLVKSFSRFVNESMEEEPETCSSCGEEYTEDEYGVSCGCNM